MLILVNTMNNVMTEDLSREELEDKTKEEILDMLEETKKEREIRELIDDNSTEEMLGKLADKFNLTKGADYGNNQLHKSGIAKILYEIEK